MLVKTSELTGPALDYAVAMCQGHAPIYLKCSPEFKARKSGIHLADYPYSTEWSYGGPIIQEEEIQLASTPQSEGYYCFAGVMGQPGWTSGPTLLIAAMRAYVRFRAGALVTIPATLMK